MFFEIKILLISFVVSIILGIIIIPILKKLKVGQIEREDGPESHLKKQGTPTMGGIIIILAILLMVTGLYIYTKATGNEETMDVVFPMALLAIGFGVIGFIDDFKKLVLKNTDGLKPKYKMLGLLIISVLYVIYLIYEVKIGTKIYIPIVKTYIEIPIYLYIPFAILVILATTNAVNLTDGVDGLSSSVSVIIIACLAIVGVMANAEEVTIFASIVMGAVLGFLTFNLHPAKVFMGDTGSLMLGGVISGLALYLRIPVLLIVIAIVPVIETVSVIIQVLYFKKTGKRIFKMTPIHHHFELSGWKENKIVIIFSAVTLVACTIGLMII